MGDLIKLLPDSLANQIAAGEVIQRPASVVKELLENSVDAGSTAIHLIVRDAGAALIQVVDNGRGMSEADARMSLERHATSKISTAEDLFRIRTMGFRGEALASIAAVARIEIKTRPAEREVGTELVAEASRVRSQEVCAHPIGTSICVKNLFFNVPARRKFLKSDKVELNHIIDEFQRVALAHPEIEFRMHRDDDSLFHLASASLRKRITAIFGKSFEAALVPVEEQTSNVRITGFIAKPDTARKTRGEQYFFVNGRFFRSSYYHAAVQQAFEGLLPNGYFPSYFIYFEVDPETIDVNIHPTKTEIKFEDERNIFAILRSAVKRSIGHYHIAPSLDFERETAFDFVPKSGQAVPAQPGIRVNPDFNPFQQHKPSARSTWEQGQTFRKPESAAGWEQLYETLDRSLETSGSHPFQLQPEFEANESEIVVRQIAQSYVMVQSSEGVFLLHQYRAHCRVLFEQFEQTASGPVGSQQLLFPVTIELAPKQANLFTGILPVLRGFGFEVEPFGKNTFLVRGTPPACSDRDVAELLAGFTDDFSDDRPSDAAELRHKAALSLARQSAMRTGQALRPEEMISLFRQLMRCRQPQTDLKGRPTFVLMNGPFLDKIFQI